jgi:ankyrin repeat protein
MLLLLDLGSEVDAVDTRGCSSVHWAAYKGNVPALTALMRRRADMTLVDKEGMQPIHRCE